MTNLFGSQGQTNASARSRFFDKLTYIIESVIIVPSHLAVDNAEAIVESVVVTQTSS